MSGPRTGRLKGALHPALCSALISLLAIVAAAQDFGAEFGSHPGFPRRLRQRSGVVVQDPDPFAAEFRDASAGALSVRELRRLSLRPRGRALRDLSRWPKEPATPDVIDTGRLAHALDQLCPPTAPNTGNGTRAAQVLAAARAFDVDPFLLAALMYHQSSCDPALKNAWGVGLTMLNRGLLPNGLGAGMLRYLVPAGSQGWTPITLAFEPPAPWAPGALLDPATNLYTAAALLRMYRDQCPELDGVFQSGPHRHHVSHFIWGDRVRDAAPEDGVLIARRRLLRYYLEEVPRALVKLGGVAFGSPLDGEPRIVTSGLGEAREHGKRAHAGVDFFSRHGEPVRAVADGVVTRAGTDLVDGTLHDLAPAEAPLVAGDSMGVRGLFVEITHDQGYRSVYAHFASYLVSKGDRVRRGDLIGYVGRTGVRESDAHLHFGLFDEHGVMDPVKALAPYLFAPELEQRERHSFVTH